MTDSRKELTATQILVLFFTRLCGEGRLDFVADRAHGAYRDMANELTAYGYKIVEADLLEAAGKYFSVERVLSHLVCEKVLFPVNDEDGERIEFRRGAGGRLERLRNKFDLAPDVETALTEAAEVAFQIHSEEFFTERVEA